MSFVRRGKSYIDDFRWLERHIVRHNFIDRNYEGDVIYAIDSNILPLYYDPETEGPYNSKNKRLGYSQLFANSDQDVAVKLATALSHYIFFKLQEDVPLIVFSHQFNEINNLVNGMVRKVAGVDVTNKDVLENLKSTFEYAKKIDRRKRSLSQLNSEENFRQSVTFSADSLINALSAGSKLERFKRVANKENPRFATIPYILENFSNVIDSDDADEPEDIIGAAQVRKIIYDRLCELKPRKYAQGIENDKNALYNLLFINLKLAKKRKRLVFISGDEHLAEASVVLNDFLAELLGENYDGKEGYDFPDYFIRHPLSLLGRSDFFGKVGYWQDTEENFVIDLNSLGDDLISISAEKEFTEIDTVFNFLSFYKEDKSNAYEEDYLEKISKEFDDYIAGRLVEYAYDQDYLMSFDGEQGRRIQSYISKIKGSDSSSEQLRYIYNEVNNDLFSIASQVVFNIKHDEFSQSGIENEKLCYRVAPFLRFEKVSAAQNYVDSWIIESESSKLYDKDKYREDLLESIKEQDTSHYSKTLCNAHLWAYLDDWHVVLGLASRAFQIAIDLLDEYDHSKQATFLGHEAAYLCVISMRHLSHYTNHEDLDEGLNILTGLIDITNVLWDKFKDANDIESLEFSYEEYRFLHEKSSIDLMRIWYDLFYFHVRKNDASAVNQINRQLNTIGSYLYATTMEIESELQGCNDDGRQKYLKYAQRHFLNNFCLVAIVLSQHERMVSELSLENIKEVLALYESSSGVNAKDMFSNKSYLHKCVMGVAKYLYGEPSNPALEKRNLYLLLDDEKIYKYSRKPYEKSRYEFFRGILG